MKEVIKNNSVYVAKANKNKEMVYKWIPLSDVEIEDGKTLGECLEEKDKEILELKARQEKLEEEIKRLEKVIEDTIRGFITK